MSILIVFEFFPISQIPKFWKILKDHYGHHKGVFPHLKGCLGTGDGGKIPDDCEV